MVSALRPEASVNTATWLPCNGSSVNTSAIVYRRIQSSEAISSRVVTVVQFRAVARTPKPEPASLVHIFDRPTPSGCHAYSSRPIVTSFSDGAAAAAIFCTA